MRGKRFLLTLLLALVASAAAASLAEAQVHIQCPGDTNNDAVPDVPDPLGRRIKCAHLTAGDGFIRMGDGSISYIFGFADATGIPARDVQAWGLLAANFAAPTLVMEEDDHYYLTLTNVGFVMRPDLFDPHSVHFHGLPHAAPVMDGLPESGPMINQGSSFTFYYHPMDAGTYLYHCHVEATEHMQMGMLGSLYVKPAQNRLPAGTQLAGGFVHQAGYQYAYNDGDGSTYYDVEVPIQLGSFDPTFHDQHSAVQPLPFALMRDKFALLNGRGYPDTVNPNPLPGPADNGGRVSQPISALVTAPANSKVLLRISNVSITRYFTLASLGIPMKVVGWNARLLRGPSGKDLTYTTTLLDLGGGESADVILDTTGLAPGSRYFLYTTNLNYLSNNKEDFGGLITEIRIQ